MELKLFYEHGRMTIYLDKFFPTTSKKIRMLYSIIMESSENKDDVVDRILDHIDKIYQDMEWVAIKAAKNYADDKTAYQEKKSQYKEGKKANGIPIREDERPAWKDAIKEMDKRWRADKKLFDLTKRQQKKLVQNRQLLMSLNGRC